MYVVKVVVVVVVTVEPPAVRETVWDLVARLSFISEALDLEATVYAMKLCVCPDDDVASVIVASALADFGFEVSVKICSASVL